MKAAPPAMDAAPILGHGDMGMSMDMMGMDHSGHDMSGGSKQSMESSSADMKGMDHSGHDMSGGGGMKCGASMNMDRDRRIAKPKLAYGNGKAGYLGEPSGEYGGFGVVTESEVVDHSAGD